MSYFKKFLILIMITVLGLSFNAKVYADKLSTRQQLIYMQVKDLITQKNGGGIKQFIDILLREKREDRGKVCRKVMDDSRIKNPIASYTAANCLLYNGYGKQAIPLFTEFLFNGNNEKYMNGRIGYGWLHSADWYKVGKVLPDMTNNQPIYEWVISEIRKEVISRPSKYKSDAAKKFIRRSRSKNSE